MKHCWDIEKCGREPGGKNADSLGVCPAAIYMLKHEAYVEIAEVMIAAIDRKGDIIFMNRKGHEILGYKPNELIGKNWFKLLIPKNSMNKLYSMFCRIINGEIPPPDHFENELIKNGGKKILISFHNTIMKNRDGSISGILFSGEDITEQRKIENQLIESKKQLETIISSTLDAIVMIDQVGNIELWNRAAEKMFGYKENEVKGNSIVETIIPSDYRQKARAGLFRFRNDDIEFKGHIKEANAVRKDGTLFPVEISISMIMIDNKKHAIAIVRDMTEHKMKEKMIRDSEKMFRLASEKSSVATYIIQDNLFRYVNPAFEKLFGYSSSEIIGKLSPFEIIEDESLLNKGIDALISGKTSEAQYYIKGIGKNGKSIFLDINIENIRYDGKPAIVGTAIDITDQIDKELRLQNEIKTIKKATQHLKELASIDWLTGIYNRRMFDEGLSREWKRMARENSSISMIMIDIDLFKGYNDSYGHHAGDKCLKSIAKSLKESLFRAADFVARYGGEEFAAILPDTKLNGAILIANRMRKNIENLHIPYDRSPILKCVTVSLGVAAIIPRKNIHPSRLIKMADLALYKAKASGRNRVAIFDEALR